MRRPRRTPTSPSIVPHATRPHSQSTMDGSFTLRITLMFLTVGLAYSISEASMTTNNNGSELKLCTAEGSCLTLGNSAGESTVPCVGADVVVKQGQCMAKEKDELGKANDKISQLEKSNANLTAEVSIIKAHFGQLADAVINLTKQQEMTNRITLDPTGVEGNYEHITAPPLTWLINVPHATSLYRPDKWSDAAWLLQTATVYNLGGGAHLPGQVNLTVVDPQTIQAPLSFSSRKALRLVTTASTSGPEEYPGICFISSLGSGASLRIRFIARLPVGFRFATAGNYARQTATQATHGTGTWEYYSFNIHKPLDSATPIPHAEGYVWVAGPEHKTLTYDVIDYQVEVY